jgi:hypothetical protein
MLNHFIDLQLVFHYAIAIIKVIPYVVLFSISTFLNLSYIFISCIGLILTYRSNTRIVARLVMYSLVTMLVRFDKL